MKRTDTKRIALASIMCALAVVFCMIGCVFDMADLAACTAASAIVAMSCIELSGKYPYLIYAVTSALLLLFFPTASTTLFFILFFGYYPIIKAPLARLPRWLSRVLGFVIFNAAAVGSYILMTKILLTAEAESEMLMTALLWIVANVFFAVYDYALTVLCIAYVRHYRKKLGIDKFLLKK